MESPENPTNVPTSKLKEDEDVDVDDGGSADVENPNKINTLLQDKVIWKQRFDSFIFQATIVQQMIELQDEAIKQTLAKKFCFQSNEEIAKRVDKAMHQLKEDYNSFLTHHRKKLLYIDEDEYKDRCWNKNKADLNYILC